MKTIVFILATVALTSFAVFDVFNDLNTTQEKGKEYITNAIASGIVFAQSEIKEKARSLSMEEQVRVTRELIQFAKEYTKTDEFKESYKKWRKEKLNPGEKTKLGLPKFGKILDNKINNSLDKGKNDKNFPADPNDLIRQRLKEFLETSTDVDYDAELTDAKQFKNPQYEKKSAVWKACYRAGKEVVAAARQEAQQWLSELEK